MLLDTHVVLWWASGDDRLTARAAQRIAAADRVLVSPVSCWEIATLVRLERIALDREVHRWVADLYSEERVDQAPLDPRAATAAGLLPDEFPGDPADRLLYATARELVVPFVTKDARIRRFARRSRVVQVVW